MGIASFTKVSSKTKTKLLFFTLVTSLFILLGIWSFSSPTGASPDDDFHLGSIWCANGTQQGLCQLEKIYAPPGELRGTTPYFTDFCFKFRADISANCVPKKSESSTQLLRVNGGAYPGGYYYVLHLLASKNTELSVKLIKLANAALFTVLFGFALYYCKSLTRQALTNSVLITLVPLAIFIIPSVNPSSWAYTALATNWAFMIAAMENQFRSRTSLITWIFFLVSGLMAISSRADASVYLLLSMALVALIKREKIMQDFRKIVAPAVLGLLAVATVMRTTQGNLNDQIPLHPGLTSMQILIFNLIHTFEYQSGALGINWGIGWLDTPIPPLAGLIGFGFYAFIAISIFSEGTKISKLVWAIIFAALTLLPVYVLQQGRFTYGEAVQPRYILPLMPLIIGLPLAALKTKTIMMMMTKKYWHLLTALFTVSASISLYANMRRYITGLDEQFSLRLSTKAEWWAHQISPDVLFFVGVISTFIFASSAVALANNEPRLATSEELS